MGMRMQNKENHDPHNCVFSFMLKIFGFIAAMILSPWAKGTHGEVIENI